MISSEQLEDVFARGGLLERGLENYEKRDEQLMMAQDVAACYNGGQVGVIEAGTGIGKSYAYLAVAILNALENKEDRTVVATSNVALQQQLMNKDLPTLERVLGTDVPYALLLGRARYVCISRMLGLRDSQAKNLFKSDESDAESILEWFRNTKTGIVEELEQRLLSSPLIARVRSDKDSCLRQRCPHFQKCFYYSAIAKAKASRIIVTNHALLFIDSSIRASHNEDYSEDAIIPLYNRLVIDECHNIDRSATEFYSLYLDRGGLNDVYKKLFQITYRAKGGKHLADIIMDFRGDTSLDDARSFSANVNAFHSEVTSFLASLVTRQDRMNYSRECLIDEAGQNFDMVHSANARFLLSTAEQIIGQLSHFINVDVEEDNEVYKRKATTILEIYRGWAELLRLFIDHASHDELVYYYSWSEGEEASMTVSPLYVGPTLERTIFNKLETVVCTSATVKAGKDFSYFLKQVGLDKRRDLVNGFYASPFDYSRNAMLLYPAREDGLKFNVAIRERYAQYIADMLVPVINMSEGSALVLFTSINMMNLVYSLVHDRIGQELLIQSRGSSTEKLRSRFRENESSVLFGLKSFWEGIDVPGSALKVLVVTQLPFPHVEDPIKKARGRDMSRRGEDPYALINIPEMLITLKQGLGRLIRSESDRGVAIIADARTQRYIESIRACIPPYYVPEAEGLYVESFADRVGSFLYG